MKVVSLHAGSSCYRRNSTCCTKFPPKGKKCGNRSRVRSRNLLLWQFVAHVCGNLDKENIWYGKMINHGIEWWFQVCKNLGSLVLTSISLRRLCSILQYIAALFRGQDWRSVNLSTGGGLRCCVISGDSSVFSSWRMTYIHICEGFASHSRHSGPWHIKMRSHGEVFVWRLSKALWTALHLKTPSFQASATDL